MRRERDLPGKGARIAISRASPIPRGATAGASVWQSGDCIEPEAIRARKRHHHHRARYFRYTHQLLTLPFARARCRGIQRCAEPLSAQNMTDSTDDFHYSEVNTYWVARAAVPGPLALPWVHADG